MRHAILIHSLVEALGGLILIFYPSLLFIAIDRPETLALIRMYALLATSFGAISFWFWYNFEYSKSFKWVYLIIIAFHIFLSFHLSGISRQGILMDNKPLYTHILVVIILMLMYFKDINKFNTT